MKKIFQCKEINEIDRFTIAYDVIASFDLMERAAKAITSAITKRWDKETSFIVFAGPGNNGGDALAVARLLVEKGYQVSTYLFNITGKISSDCMRNRDMLSQMVNTSFTEVTKQFNPPHLTDKDIIIDGLFGSGLNKPLSGGFAGLVNYINASPSKVISIDIPSGLEGDGNRFNTQPNVIVKADLTLTLQLPKLAFYFRENQDVIGEWEVLDIRLSAEGIKKTETSFFFLEEDDIKALIKTRPQFAHKGDFGHALLIAGSYGMAGASILSAKACLRSGVGLLHIHAPRANMPILQTSVPEAIIEPDTNEFIFSRPSSELNYQAIGIGPGLGKRAETVNAFANEISACQSHLVLDADALNILAEHKEFLSDLPDETILTPHPKELERLVGECNNSYQRMEKAIDLAAEIKSYIILKGAYSMIITPDGKCYLNPTGNPGMATGGSGDVLTGIILALTAQGYSSYEACLIGTYVHGLAGDIAAKKIGMISMTAMDIVDALPAAWKNLSNQQTI